NFPRAAPPRHRSGRGDRPGDGPRRRHLPRRKRAAAGPPRRGRGAPHRLSDEGLLHDDETGRDRALLSEQPAPAESQRLRVLVVDDDPIAAESLAEFLHAEGHIAATAFNAEEALAALAQTGGSERGGPFNIVISDVSMPGMGGIELLRRIGKEHPGVVVIMLTGYGTIESAVEALRLG